MFVSALFLLVPAAGGSCHLGLWWCWPVCQGGCWDVGHTAV